MRPKTIAGGRKKLNDTDSSTAFAKPILAHSYEHGQVVFSENLFFFKTAPSMVKASLPNAVSGETKYLCLKRFCRGRRSEKRMSSS